MEALQTEIVGWLGYLDRWSVSWQIAFILFVAIAAAFTRRSKTLVNNNQPLANHVAPLTLMGTGLLLGIAQIPSVIVLQVGLFWALFHTVSWIESKIKINNRKSIRFVTQQNRETSNINLGDYLFYRKIHSLSAIR